MLELAHAPVFVAYLVVVFLILRKAPEAQGLYIGLASCACAMLLPLNLIAVPSGTSVRPMAHAAMIVLVGLVALVFGLPMSVKALFKKETRSQGIAGILLALAPVIVGIIALHAVASIRGLRFSE